MVYLFKARDTYKIGKSHDVQRRFEVLSIGNPYLEIICFGAFVKESDLHDYFSSKKIKNEWFSLNEKEVVLAKNFITGKSPFIPRYKIKTSGNRFYKVVIGGHERYYRNLNKLCKCENLSYTNIHYEILRKNNLSYSKLGVFVELLQFE